MTGSEEKGSHTGISQNFRQLGSTSSKGNNALQLVTVPGLQAGAHAQALQVLGCEQSPPACVASTLSAEPFPQPATFNKNFPLLQVRFFFITSEIKQGLASVNLKSSIHLTVT